MVNQINFKKNSCKSVKINYERLCSDFIYAGDDPKDCDL
jgi:hypothetical protein